MELNYKPTERQIEAHKAPQMFKLYGGAMGGGKSHWLCMETLLLCLEYPKNRALMARYHLSDFKNTTLVTFFRIVPEQLIEFHNKTDHIIRLVNGSEILYMGLSEESDVNKLKSMEIGVFAFDEASEIPQEQFLLASSRFRHKLADGRHPKFFGLLTSNPEDCWLKDKFIRGKVDRSRYVFIPALPKDNPHLPTNYVENLKKDYPDDWIARYLEGSWEDLTVGNFVITRDLVEDALNKEIVLPHRYCMGVDVARGVGGDETVMYVGNGGFVSDWYFSTSDRLDETTIKTQKFIEQYSIESVAIDDIGIGAGITDNLTGLGYAVEGINVGRRSEDERFFNLRAHIWWNLRDMLVDGLISIPNDEKLIRQLSAVKYRIRNSGKLMLETKEDTKRRIGQSPDRGDALVLMAWASRNVKEKQKDYARTFSTEKRSDPYGWDAYYKE